MFEERVFENACSGEIYPHRPSHEWTMFLSVTFRLDMLSWLQLEMLRIQARYRFDSEGVFATVFELCSRLCSSGLANLRFRS